MIVSPRGSLKRCWQAFFSPFGGRLLPVQEAAIPLVFEGRDLLVSSPTAGGKTEAVTAPLLERALAESWSSPSIVYVCPTRPLVNDLYRRLSLPMTSLGTTCDRRTGDHPRPVQRCPPLLLITTPESLDSLLCRHPRIFEELRAVVLDEAHLLTASARGDQCAILLSRLRHLVSRRSPKRRLQTVALTATPASPDQLLDRFLVQGEIVSIPGSRPLETRLERWTADSDLGGLVAREVNRLTARKVLVFVNRRQDAETLAGILGSALPFGGQVFAHHGSLCRSFRESVEERFLTARYAAVVATSTLELGIDIGDVDLVVLPFPPADVTAFLQRIGRGNRRSGTCQVLALYRTPAQREWLRFLIDSARSGRLYPDPSPFRPSVVMQQILSLLYQGKGAWISAAVVHDRLPDSLRPVFPVARIERLAQALVDSGYLSWTGKARLSSTAEADRLHRLGQIHSNIDQAPPVLEVIDEFTKERLGSIARSDVSPTNFSLGGRGMRVIRSDPERIYVRGDASNIPAPLAARPPPRLGLEIAQAFGGSLGREIPSPVMVTAGEGLALVHFAGTLASHVLGAWLEHRGLGRVSAIRGLAVRFTPSGARPVRLPSRSELEKIVVLEAATISRALGLGPMGARLPVEETLALATEALDLGRLETLLRSEVGEPQPTGLPDGLPYL